jgi:four helix bundle protein
MNVRGYQGLKVWQAAFELSADCYEATKRFPKEELFGLTSQIRRAASSIPANVAEGQGRYSSKEFLRFLNIARGSTNELETHLLLSHRIGLLEKQALEPLMQASDQVSRMLAGLKDSIKRKL